MLQLYSELEKSYSCTFQSCSDYGWKWENPPTANWQSYYANYLQLGSYDIRLQPFYLLPGGYLYTGSLDAAGALGNYWSSAAYDTNGAYRLHFNSAYVYPSNDSWRFDGFFIRCLAR